MGGWVLALSTTGALAAAAYWVAAAVFLQRGLAERTVATILFSTTGVLWSVLLCGTSHHFTPGFTAAVGLALATGAAGWASRRLSGERLIAQFLQDLGAPRRLWHDAWESRELAFWVVPVAVAALAASAVFVWYFRSWAWDAVWYHVPITAFAVQNASTGWIETHIPWISSYPRNVEWLAAWACVFARDNRLDDSAQLPFAVLGMAVIAAWARRLGARPALAGGAAAAFLLLPPVFLQVLTTHVDVACAAFFAAAIFFFTEPASARSRTMSALAMGLYVGSKFSGVFHLLLWLPWAGVRAAQEWRASPRRGRTALGMLASTALFLSVSAQPYVENTFHRGNPFSPFQVSAPLVGTVFEGPWTQARLFEQPSSARLYFFGQFARTWKSWFETTGDYWPDLRTGGFGPLFRWLLLPALALLAIQLLRRRLALREALPVLALFFTGLAVPAAWWPRFIMSVPIAALVAFTAVQRSWSSRPLRAAVSLAFVVAACGGFGITLSRMKGPFPHLLLTAVRAPPAVRATLQLESWMWPTFWAQTRDRELTAGDTVAYDESTSFVGEFFSPDYRTRVVFVPSAGDPQRYLERLREVNARWVGVRGGSAAERAVREAGGQFLFTAPRSDVVLYRFPTTLSAVAAVRRAPAPP